MITLNDVPYFEENELATQEKNKIINELKLDEDFREEIFFEEFSRKFLYEYLESTVEDAIRNFTLSSEEVDELDDAIRCRLLEIIKDGFSSLIETVTYNYWASFIEDEVNKIIENRVKFFKVEMTITKYYTVYVKADNESDAEYYCDDMDDYSLEDWECDSAIDISDVMEIDESELENGNYVDAT